MPFNTSPAKTKALTPLTRCASFRGYCELVTKLGGDPQALLQCADLDKEAIANEDLMIPTYMLCNALELACRELKTPDFALRLIQNQGFDSLGLLGVKLQNSSSLEEMLYTLMTTTHEMHDHGSNLITNTVGDDLYLQCEQSIPQAIGINQRLFLVLGFVAKMAREVIRPSIKAKAIYFRCKAPSDTSIFKEIFDTDVYFEQEFDGAIVDMRTFQKKHNIVKTHISNVKPFCTNNTSNTNISLSQKLSLMITSSISMSHIDIEYYANHLQLSVRSLQRGLKKENSSFSKILDHVRKDLALRYIQQGNLNLAQITEILSFSEQAVFTRAFRRWYNNTPKQYIKSHSHVTLTPSPVHSKKY